MGIKEVFDLPVPDGKIVIAWINSYSGIVLKTLRTTLVFDPIMINPAECFKADEIIITHEHYDHFSPSLVRALHHKTNARILTTQFVAQRLADVDTQVLRVNDRIVCGDLSLLVTLCEHSANEPLAFVISTQDGILLYHPGDSKPIAEMAQLAEKHKPDILLYSGNSLKNAAQIASLIKPQVTISYYSDAESLQRFRNLMATESPSTNAVMLKRFQAFQYPIRTSTTQQS